MMNHNHIELRINIRISNSIMTAVIKIDLYIVYISYSKKKKK